MSALALLALAGTAAASPLLARQETTIDTNAAPPNISTLPAQSLFSFWRPKAHILPPSGHTGDPMGAFADPSTGLFHQAYLYTPFNVTGRNAGAGATTADFVTWTDLTPDDPSFIRSGGKNDELAVFDGTVIPSGVDGLPTLIYTSVAYLPISWTVPYVPGSETQSIAVSNDSGVTFNKLEQGPVLASAPFGVDPIGWRDPFMFQNPQFDSLLNSTDGVWYSTISGGDRNAEGPGLFLYRQANENYTSWEYLGIWWDEERNSTWGDGTWAGRWGVNFEVGNVFGLDEQGDDPSGSLYTLVGTEGGDGSVSGGRAQLWASGDLLAVNNTADFNVTMAGILDWGKSSYAAASKVAPSDITASQSSGAPDRQICAVWITSDFFGGNPYPYDQTGWDGQLALPRELYEQRITNVVNDARAQETGSWRIISNDTSGETVDLITLGQYPLREIVSAWEATSSSMEEVITLESTDGETRIEPFNSTVSSRYFVLTASLAFPAAARDSEDLAAGFRILSSEFESTDIYYQFSNESMIVDRSNSSAVAVDNPGLDSFNEAGRHRLWDRNTNGTATMETLDLTIVVDNSVIEIFANERFALATLAYPWYNASTGISFYQRGPLPVVFSNVTIYEGLFDAWPERSR